MSYDLKTLTGDIAGAVTSTAIVLPWALAAGVASGLGPLAGLYGTIAIGFFAAVFGGTRAQSSDTSAPMLVAMTVVLTQYAGNLAQAFTIVMLAGLMQIALGALRVGRFVSHTPYSVIAGIMAGIGIVMMIGQVSPLLGATATLGGGLVETVRAWPGAFAALDANAAVVGAVTLAVCIWWPPRIGRFLPAYLAALVVGTAVAFALPGGVPTVGALPTGLPMLQAPVLSPDFLAGAVQPALILAFISSVNSLLSSQMHDSLTLTRHKPGSGAGGPGTRQHRRRPAGNAARLGVADNHRRQHPGRRPHPGVRRAAFDHAARSGSGGRRDYRGHSDRRPRRHHGEDRLGYRRLAFPRPRPRISPAIMSR